MNISSIENRYVTGRLSDGSDKQEIVTFDVTVVNGSKTYFKVCDIVPTELNIDLTLFKEITPIAQPTNLEINAKLDMVLGGMNDLYMTIVDPNYVPG